MRRGQILRALNAKIITDKRLISLIYKEFVDIEKVKDNNPEEKQAKGRTDSSQMRRINGSYICKKMHNLIHKKNTS